MEQLAARMTPSARMKTALDAIFNAAKAKGVRILIDAEQHYIQEGVDLWALQAQERYNNGKAVIFNTYQAYLQSTPATLARHLAIADKKGFVLGVKLVRGAYFGTDPQHIFWSSKVETDRTFDGIAEALIRRSYNDVLTPVREGEEEKNERNGTPKFAEAEILLATHNYESVRKAVKTWTETRRSGTPRPKMAFAQLMGMADEISCELLMAAKNQGDEHLSTYKYLPWGTVRECLGYLARRAEENRLAVDRAREERRALNRELRRRILRGNL